MPNMTDVTPGDINMRGAAKLAAAVLNQAIREAEWGDPKAIYWLYSLDAAFYANLAELDDTKPLVEVAGKCDSRWNQVHLQQSEEDIARALGRL